MSGTEPILAVRQLRKVYERRTGLRRTSHRVVAVDDVDFELRPGEVLGVVGESGSGKSTTARLIMRLIEPSAGEIIFRGQPIQGLQGRALRALRHDMQMVFQDPFAALNPRMTIAEHLHEPLALHTNLDTGGRRRRVDEVMHTVGLDPGQAGRYPHEFSGGQRQRICIARAIAVSPQLLVADEPVSALDLSIQAQILNLLQTLRDRLNLTILFISHDLAVVRYIADRIAVMVNGAIVEEGPRDAIFAKPRHPYTQTLMRAIPGLSATSDAAPNHSEHSTNKGDKAFEIGCRYQTRCPHARSVCRQARPPFDQVSPTHRVACVRWQDLDRTESNLSTSFSAPSPALKKLQQAFRDQSAITS